MFEDYLKLWLLTPDGDPIVTPNSRLLPVRRQGEPAMLKLAVEPEEKFGVRLMEWWDGDGAAHVLAQAGDAILLERAQAKVSLSALARTGRDDEATRIICNAVAKLHAPRAKPLPRLMPLAAWFRELEPAAAAHGGPLIHAAAHARALLADPREPVVLHGDIHHDNVLDFGARGWLAIDPKGLFGERGFDYANLFCNPDLSDPSPPVATIPENFERRLKIVSEEARLEPRRLLQWIIAWTGLSAAWFLSDGLSPEIDFRVGELATSALGG